MNISNSYSAPGILQPSFSSSQPHTHTQSEITTTHTNNKYTGNGNNTEIKSDHLERVKKSQVILEKYPDRVPVIIQPSKKVEYALSELVSGINSKNSHGEVSFGKPVGKELL